MLTFVMMTRFVMIAGALNAYCDGTREWTTLDGSDAKCGTTKEEASANFDLGLLLFGIHHIIEYMRILVLWVVSMIGINLMHMYYAFAFNTILGLVAFVISIAEVASGEGCSTVQANRATWLVVEIVMFITTATFYSFP
jgi:hypothetical protein